MSAFLHSKSTPTNIIKMSMAPVITLHRKNLYISHIIPLTESAPLSKTHILLLIYEQTTAIIHAIHVDKTFDNPKKSYSRIYVTEFINMVHIPKKTYKTNSLFLLYIFFIIDIIFFNFRLLIIYKKLKQLAMFFHYNMTYNSTSIKQHANYT